MEVKIIIRYWSFLKVHSIVLLPRIWIIFSFHWKVAFLCNWNQGDPAWQTCNEFPQKKKLNLVHIPFPFLENLLWWCGFVYNDQSLCTDSYYWIRCANMYICSTLSIFQGFGLDFNQDLHFSQFLWPSNFTKCNQGHLQSFFQFTDKIWSHLVPVPAVLGQRQNLVSNCFHLLQTNLHCIVNRWGLWAGLHLRYLSRFRRR